MAITSGLGRIPNLPSGNMFDDEGNLLLEEASFRQALITSLQQNFGDEGVVIPSQTSADIEVIRSNTIPNPSTGAPEYTCQFGTMIFDTDLNTIVVAVNDGTGVPIFKQVTLS